MQNPDFKLNPSKQYAVFLLIALAISAGCILYVPFTLALKVLCLMSTLIYGAYVYWQAVLLRGKQAITHIKYLKQGLWQVTTPHECYEASLSGDSTVTRHVTLLRFKTPKRLWPLSAVIFPDALAKDRYRELLVILRML